MASNVAQGSTRLILTGSAMLLSIGMGLRQSIGLFLTPVTRDLALTAADFTLTIAIQNIVWGLAQAPAGAIADRFGLRLTLVAGTMIYIAGLAAMAAAGGETALIVSGVLIGIALSCTASSLALAACARAVPERSRSKMLGVVAAVGSLGTFIVPIATQGVLKYYPWQIGVLFLCGPRRRDAAGRRLGRCLGQASGDDGGSEDDDARYAGPGAAPSRLSRDVGSLFRLRAKSCLFDDAPAGLLPTPAPLSFTSPGSRADKPARTASGYGSRGACTRGIYDNMKTAVETVFVGKDRQFTRRFVQMCGPGIRARDHKITGGFRYRRSDRRSRRGSATDPSIAKAPAVVRSDSGCCLRPCLDAVMDF